MADSLPEISPTDLKARLDAGDKLTVVDVREREEHAASRLEVATLIPLSEFAERFEELDRDHEYVIMCRRGNRSARAAQFLQHQGFTNVSNLAGGITAWARDVDPSLNVE